MYFIYYFIINLKRKKKIMNTRLISKKRPGDLRQVYVAIDFETIDINVWWTFGLVISTFPNGNIIQKFQVGCNRLSHVCVDKDIAAFWKRNVQAFDSNKLIGGKNTVEEAELSIVHFIKEIKEKYDFFLISDNPTFDVKILDDILIRNDEQAICFRKNDYFQAICTWSYRLATMQLMGFKSSELNRIHASLKHPSRQLDNFLHNDDDEKSECSRHTPIHDACLITLQYFKLKDMVNNFTNCRNNNQQHHHHPQHNTIQNVNRNYR
jgi:hypothetical protein